MRTSQPIRFSLLFACILMGALLLILRLAYLQLAQYQRYATLSLRNQMSIVPIVPSRGIIFDRNGVILADNRPVYVLQVIPERVKNLGDMLKQLRLLLPSISEEDIDNFNKQRRAHRSFIPIPLKLKLTPEDVATFASHQYRFPGVSIEAQLLRYYPMKDSMAHVVGYVGRINIQELKRVNGIQYQGTNFIGKSGIEKFYEQRLHGQVGYEQEETDVSGRSLRVISRQASISGEKLYLTLDARLQKVAYEALTGLRGAAVVLRVDNGEILALVSSPSFDPNEFVKGVSNTKYQAWMNASDRPLYHRAIRGLYPPASTVKPFIALAGLEHEVVGPMTSIYDPGWYRLPGIKHVYHDWRRTGHGVINLRRAIMVSCDTYFYQLGNKLGIHKIEDMLLQFGFGQLTHIDLPEEVPGLVPSPRWKKQTRGLPWYPGDNLITSIGQGSMLATPLQLANALAAMSQRGKHYRPHLFHHAVREEGQSQSYKVSEDYPIILKNPMYWDWVIEGMHSVITNNEGTGYRFGRDAPYSVAGKTGTAQVFSLNPQDKKTPEDIPAELRDHSWFVAFAPVEKPQIAVAVLVENDVVASHVARVVMDAYFKTASDKRKAA